MVKEFKKYDNKCEWEFTIYVGENADENWKLIDDANSQNDLWFHLESQPSPHVVIKVDEKEPSNTTLNYAAALCKEYSKFKNVKKIAIIYTNIKNVSKADKPGSVTTKKTKRIMI